MPEKQVSCHLFTWTSPSCQCVRVTGLLFYWMLMMMFTASPDACAWLMVKRMCLCNEMPLMSARCLTSERKTSWCDTLGLCWEGEGEETSYAEADKNNLSTVTSMGGQIAVWQIESHNFKECMMSQQRGVTSDSIFSWVKKSFVTQDTADETVNLL